MHTGNNICVHLFTRKMTTSTGYALYMLHVYIIFYIDALWDCVFFIYCHI